jgi:putative ABC transport system permease protein
MRERQPVWLRLASRLYQLCVRLTPERFRERFGPESEDAFHHLVEDTLQNRGSGAAMTAAAAACGDVARTGIVEHSASWRSALLSGTATDIKQATRICWREPILATAIALTLALVSGPAIAISSVLYQVVLAPLPYPDAERLVVIGYRYPGGFAQYLTAASVSDYRAVRAFSTVGGIARYLATVALRGKAERLPDYRITAGLLSGLGVPFVAGRDIQRGEPDAVVTRAFAQARFGSETAAVGQTMVVDGQTLTIVGVLAYRPPLPGPPGIDLFVPHVNADRPDPTRGGGNTVVIARLNAESSVDIALEQSRTVAVGVTKRFARPDVTPELMPLGRAISGSLRSPLLMFFGAVAVVFLLAVTSLASLVLARAASRASDVAVRTSLGASRWQLIRSWMFEGAALALPGVALGTWLGDVLLRYGRTALPTGLVPVPLPETGVLGPAMVAAAALVAFTAVIFALSPIAAGLLHAASPLRLAGGSTAGRRSIHFQSLLIVVQVALSLVLVTSAAWLSISLWRTLSRPLGFDAANLVTVQTQSAQPRAVQIDLVRRVLTRLRQLDSDPVERVAISSSLPGVYANMFVPLRIRPDQPVLSINDRPTLALTTISTSYFQVLNIPLLQGRAFTAQDEAAPQTSIIVSRSFAAKWLPEGAVGHVVTLSRDDRREVIGVVEDVHASSLVQDSAPQAYLPLTESLIAATPSNYLIRSSRSAGVLRADITAMIREIDPTASVVVASADEAMGVPLRLQSLSNQLTVCLALVALLLAVVNVYALSAFAVVRRTRELGIRMALGARSGDATRLIMRRGLARVILGLVLGGGCTILLAAPLLRNQLFETRTNDPGLLAFAIVVVGGVALVASWLPARRAARIDPAITLRAE